MKLGRVIQLCHVWMQVTSYTGVRRYNRGLDQYQLAPIVVRCAANASYTYVCSLPANLIEK